MALTIAVTLVVHFTQARLPGVNGLEAALRDAWMRAQATDREDPRLALVDIDEDSLRLVGAWPWSRDLMADLAERLLAGAGASRVVFDLVMPDPGTGGHLGDQRLAGLAEQGLLVLGQALDYEARASGVQVGVVSGARRSSASGPVLAQATGHVGNHEGLSGARCVGNIGVRPDFDGKTRRLAPLTLYGGQAYPTLALAALDCLPAQGDVVTKLPLDAQGQWQVPFGHVPQAHLAISAHEVMRGTVDLDQGQALLAGRIVIVGSSALGLADRVATPVAANVSGASVHAEALSWLLDVREGRARQPPPSGVMLAWTALSALWLAWSIAGAQASLLRMGASLAVILPIWAVLAGWVSGTGGLEPIAMPILAYALILLLLLPLEWAGASGQSRRQTRLLTRYVAPTVLQSLQRDRTADVLSPRRAVITVLIADMQDYTRNTSDAGLQEAARLTKGFLQALTAPVLANRGTLDRYTGDGLVAFWGAPLPDADHADHAVDAALAILREVEGFNAQRAARGLPPVIVRMGMASGEALVGDLGTSFRISYTAVGDCINLASRLQQASRDAGVSILAADSVRRSCRRHAFEDLGVLSIRGLNDQRVGTPASDPAIPSSGEGGQAPG